MTGTPAERKRAIRELGRSAGFDLVRVAPAEALVLERERFAAWIEAGRAADMRWMTAERTTRASDVRTSLPGARSVICLGLAYWAGHRPPAPEAGLVARYAWGQDYHGVIAERLKAFAGDLQSLAGGEHRVYTDTGPVMDKAYAARSGLGWYGKNSNILTTPHGSYVLLGEVLTTLEIEPDEPSSESCGTCRLCAVACPTGAITPEYSVDSRKCISYLTIEHRGPIPRDLRPLMGAWVFGCDICQDVCPPTMEPYLQTPDERRNWLVAVRATVRGEVQMSQISTRTEVPAHHPLFNKGVRPHVDLAWLLRLSHDEYVQAFRGTAIKRAKVWMLRRNAAVAIGNVGGADAANLLVGALREDTHPVVRGHCAWALGHLARRVGANVRDDLLRALEAETDTDVREEVALALQGIPGT